MKVESIRSDPLGSKELRERPRLEAQLLTNAAPDLHLGEQLKARVVEIIGADAILDLKGARVMVDALPGLRAGAELSVRVASLSPQLLLEVSTFPRTPLPPLALGQEVTAQVLEDLSDGRVLVRLHGALLEATTQESLPPGKELTVRVEQLQPHLVLRILKPAQDQVALEAAPELEAEATRILRATLPHQAAVSDSLNLLRQELARATAAPTQEVSPSLATLHALLQELLPDDGPPSAERLAAFVRDGGLQYEAKLLRLATDAPEGPVRVADQDVKGLLLRILGEGETTLLRSETRAALMQHLSHIETQQALNVLAQLQGGPYQLQIPFLSAQGLSTAMLSIEADEGRQEEAGKRGKTHRGQGYNVLFLLDLEGFGQTRIDAHLSTKTLRVIFYVDQPQALALLQAELPGFRETLQSLGYEEVLLAAKPLAQLPAEKRPKFEALAVGVPATVSLLDVKV